MRLNLLHPTNGLSIRTVLSFPFNQTASYRRSPARYHWSRGYRKGLFFSGFMHGPVFGGHLLIDGKLDEDVVVSPLSFQMVLSLLAAGSRGYTRRQFLRFLIDDSVDHLNSSAFKLSNVLLTDRDHAVGPRVRCSTALWFDQSLALKPSFKHILHSDYRAALNPVDFQTKAPHVTQQINCWVGNETSVLVKDLIREGSLNNSVKLVFTNALYFKGAWDQKAEKGPSRLNDPWNDNLMRATFMMAKKNLCVGTSNYYFKMPHQQYYIRKSKDKRSISMIFFNPVRLLDSVCQIETLMEVNGKMTPKFNISSEVEVSDMLRKQGLTLPFSGGGLTEMLTSFDGRELYVFNIFQKAFIDINEQGTEAATATTAIVMSGCPPYLPPVGFKPGFGAILTGEHLGRVMATADLNVNQVVA